METLLQLKYADAIFNENSMLWVSISFERRGQAINIYYYAKILEHQYYQINKKPNKLWGCMIKEDQVQFRSSAKATCKENKKCTTYGTYSCSNYHSK